MRRPTTGEPKPSTLYVSYRAVPAAVTTGSPYSTASIAYALFVDMQH